jgi:phosphoribosyl 1,2-cyclic phosphodiesterase
MKLIVLDSGSKANGYILTNGSEALLIEAGVKLLEVKKALNFDISIIKGCIVSHSHADHARHIKEYAHSGINLLGPKEIFAGHHNRFKPIMPNKGYVLGSFRILPFDVPHDVRCYGYLIDHPDCGRVLFITDTYLVEYKFIGLSHTIIECNYSDNLLEQSIQDGVTHPSMRQRLMTTHMELDTLKKFLKATDLGQVINIVLIHLSDNHSDEARFMDEIAGISGKIVCAVKYGCEIIFTLKPF